MTESSLFLGWKRSSIYGLVPSSAPMVEDAQGVRRLQGQVDLVVETRDGSRSTVVSLPFPIEGPGDVAEVASAMFRKPVPADGSSGFETTKCPSIQVVAPDLPWRFTPELAKGAILRPWLVLVVATEDELEFVAGGRVRLKQSVLDAHPLQRSARTAHVQVRDMLEIAETTDHYPRVDSAAIGETIDAAIDAAIEREQVVARLVNTRPLLPNLDYRAVVVPAFGDDGRDAWRPGQGEVVVRHFHGWRFRTGEGGDFRTLAAQLQALQPEPDMGRAPLRYDRVHPETELSARGAVGPIGGGDPPLAPAVHSTGALLTLALKDERGRPVLTAPVYGAAWHDDAKSTAWGRTLNADPRHRGAAGLGAEAAIQLEDLIVEVIQTQVGPVSLIAQSIGALALGLAASRSLWTRYLPPEPEARLQLFGPALGRVMTPDGSALDVLTGPGRPLPRSLFSSAARRVLRSGPARTRHAKPGANDPVALLRRANTCPGADSPPAGLPHSTGLGAALGVDLNALLQAPALAADPIGAARARLADNPATLALLDALVGRKRPHLLVAELMARAEQGQPASTEQGQPASTEPAAHASAPVAMPLPSALAAWLDAGALDLIATAAALGQSPPPTPCRPVDLSAVANALTRAFDPTGPDAWMRQRVLATIDNLASPPEQPVEICTHVQFPAWRFLREVAPDWLLPGVDQMPRDAVMAFESNPRFIAGFLLGMNERALAELRWRNLPIAQGCTPLRDFWGAIDPGASERVGDILGVHRWAGSAELGAAANRPPNAPGTQLVLVFRTDLFRRYPDTLLYACPVRRDARGNPAWDAPEPNAAKVWPVFQGQLRADVCFFGFPITPAQGREHWLILEQLPTGLQFRNDIADADIDARADRPSLPLDSGAGFAASRVDEPVRVLIRGQRFVAPGSSAP